MKAAASGAADWVRADATNWRSSERKLWLIILRNKTLEIMSEMIALECDEKSEVRTRLREVGVAVVNALAVGTAAPTNVADDIGLIANGMLCALEEWENKLLQPPVNDGAKIEMARVALMGGNVGKREDGGSRTRAIIQSLRLPPARSASHETIANMLQSHEGVSLAPSKVERIREQEMPNRSRTKGHAITALHKMIIEALGIDTDDPDGGKHARRIYKRIARACESMR